MKPRRLNSSMLRAMLLMTPELVADMLSQQEPKSMMKLARAVVLADPFKVQKEVDRVVGKALDDYIARERDFLGRELSLNLTMLDLCERYGMGWLE